MFVRKVGESVSGEYGDTLVESSPVECSGLVLSGGKVESSLVVRFCLSVSRSAVSAATDQ